MILIPLVQDKEDDLKVGVKSTALRFGDSTKEWISGFGIACVSGLALSGFNADIGIYCFLVVLLLINFSFNLLNSIVGQGGRIMHFWQQHPDI